MIWLAALGGAGPISSTGSPIATPTIGGIAFSLYEGPNGDTTVLSFVAEEEVTAFAGDLMAFFTYLNASQGVSDALYLQSIGAGTEPFTGSDAVLTTTGYTAEVVLAAVGEVQSVVPTTSEVGVASSSVAAAAESSTTKAKLTSTLAPAATGTATVLGAAWSQCGGQGVSGPGTCVAGWKCVESNEWYSQCVPA